MNADKRIALISVHGDPAIDIGKEEAGGQNVYVRQVGMALAKQGWQVDMFTRKTKATQSTIVQHSANCRTIRLIAGKEDFIPRDKLFDYLPSFVSQLRQFQLENKIQYSLSSHQLLAFSLGGYGIKETSTPSTYPYVPFFRSSQIRFHRKNSCHC